MEPKAPPINYDESKVPAYTLPDPLILEDGSPVTDPPTWHSRRRLELLELFRRHIYGRSPLDRPDGMRFEIFEESHDALDGRAIRRQVRVTFHDDLRDDPMDILIHLPRDAAGKPIPLFVGLNFYGNHTLHPDPGIALNARWMRPNNPGIVGNRATDAARGTSPWPLKQIIDRGYGLATAYYGDIARDDVATCFQHGVFKLFLPSGQPGPVGDRCGTIGAWAWGLSRIMDYLETDRDVDSGRVIVMGHSRLGKTALWAGAQDERFAAVISNQSGCLGAAISRRRFGETVERINTTFPHWFCENAKSYNDREEGLPVDQHMLIALAAPRPVLVCSAKEDAWADPRGEFLGALHADPVYRLLGVEGIAARDMPRVNEAVLSRIGYRIRPGTHGVIPDDWKLYMDFADRHVK